jgi:phosphatidylglycerol:prolipoprotein diacylglycerol transferase
MHPVLLRVGFATIYSYGTLIAVGGACAVAFVYSKRRRMGLRTDEQCWLLINLILICCFAGGRLLYVFEYTELFSPRFWDSLISFKYGFALTGSMLATLGGVYWFSRRNKLDFLKLMDYICVAMLFVQGFGRLGCFSAGCCYGRETALPWGVVFSDPTCLIDSSLLGHKVHPTQLYEAGGDLLIGLFLYNVLLRRLQAGRLRSGIVFGTYFVLYSVLRFSVEFVRGDTVPLGGLGITQVQGFELGLFAFALLVLAVAGRRPSTRS